MNEELKIIISAEISKLKSELQKGKSEVESFASGSKGKLEEFSTGFQKVGDAAKAGLAIAGAAMVAVATSLLALVDATEEYRIGQAKLVTAFETAGSSAAQATTTYNELYRVLGDGDVAVEAAGHLAQLTTDQKALSEWTTICQGVYATFGDSLPIESLTEAANETAQTGQLTGALADALNWAGISEDDFAASLEACNSVAEREALIRETLNGLYSDAAATYEENAAAILAQNEAQAKLEASMAAVGEALSPVKTALTELGANILAQLVPYIEQFAADYLPQIVEALGNVGTAIGEVITWIADNWGVISTIGAIVLAVAAAISAVSTALGIYNAVMAITTVVSAPVIGIIAAVVAGIAALVAIIVLCVKHWDQITAAIGKFAEAVGEWLSGLWDSISSWISDVVAAFSEWIGNVKASFSEFFGNVKSGFSSFWNSVKNGWSNFWTGVGEKITQGVNKAKSKFDEMKENVSQRMSSIQQNVTQKFSAVKEVMGQLTGQAVTYVQGKLDVMKAAYEANGGGIKGIVSASYAGIKSIWSDGVNALNTITNGKFGEIISTISGKLSEAASTVSGVLNSIKSTFQSIWDGAKNIVSSAIETIKGFFNFSWSLPKIALPHFSISGSFSLNPPSIPKFSVSWYELGGIFDNPTLFGYGNGQIGGLGENGAEAIVPLEKNTKWLDRIAERLYARQGSTPIILEVDGKVFAQTSINSINQLTRQTGKLSLNLV